MPIWTVQYNLINLNTGDFLYCRHCFICDTDGCDLNNGGCEQRCIRGNPDRCDCNSGFQLSTNERDCIGKCVIDFPFLLHYAVKKFM